MKLSFCIALEGCVCYENIEDFKESVPILVNIQAINNLLKEGHKIILNSLQIEDDREEVISWLKKHSVGYSELTMNRPEADIHIDNKNAEADYLRYFADGVVNDEFELIEAKLRG